VTFYTQYFITFCILSSLLLLSLKKNKDRLAAKLVHRSRNHPGGVDSMAFGSPLVVYPWKSPPFGSIKVQDVQAPTG
jgi:hypothetical protein